MLLLIVKPVSTAQMPKLCALKRAIKLNTRTGCARFIIALTTRQGVDIKPHTAAFIKVTNFWLLVLTSRPMLDPLELSVEARADRIP